MPNQETYTSETYVIIGLDNNLLTVRHQANLWTNAVIWILGSTIL